MKIELLNDLVALSDKLNQTKCAEENEQVEKIIRNAMGLADVNQIVEKLVKAVRENKKDEATNYLALLNRKLTELSPVTGNLKTAEANPNLAIAQQIEMQIPALFSKDEQQKKKALSDIRKLMKALKDKLTLRSRL